MTILVSGSLAYDRIMDFPGKFSDHILPEKIHILSVCFTINGLRENFGGTAGNIAYGLSLLGERPLVIASAGRDFGYYREWLQERGITTAHVRVVDEELTAGAYITTDQSDNQITAFNPGAMRHRAPFDVAAVDPAGALAIIAPGNLEDMRELARAYHKRGIRYIFDPGQSIPGWSAGDLLETLRGSAIFISNDYELELVQEKCGLGAEELAALTGSLITTRGEYGSTLRRAEGGRIVAVDIQPVRTERVKDPTGAGDAFRAGLIKGLGLAGGDVIHAARLGSVAAVYAVEVYGTQSYSFAPEAFNRRFAETYGGTAF